MVRLKLQLHYCRLRWARFLEDRQIVWKLKQLLPFKYRTTFTEVENAGQAEEAKQRRRCVWRMWFGRCFAISTFDI